MFSKSTRIFAVTAALLLTSAGGVAFATTPTQSAPDRGPCVTAVWKDDPTITAKSGNCPIDAPVEAGHERTATYSVDLTVGAMGWMPPERGLHITVVNQTSGRVIIDAGSRGVEQVKDAVTVAPTYLVTFAVDGQSFSRSITAADFRKSFEDDTTTAWVLTGNTVFDSVAHKFLDDFSADPAMEYVAPGGPEGPALEWTP